MHRSSESIAYLAAALAKAQGELINPEKSLTATIQGSRAGEGDRSFRYAPLSSGLDIVRKTLGQHEIATVQTTAIDQTAGTVNLTTVLCHASGEWIASDWPVCAISDTASPRRMGAALTYARRYALFTLVGIAGEDDIDAPDLPVPTGPASEPERPEISKPTTWTNGAGRRNGARVRVPLKATLEPDKSAKLRDQLLSELEVLITSEAATTWAHRILGTKNSLTAADARSVEDAFRVRMANLENQDATAGAAVSSPPVQSCAALSPADVPAPSTANAPAAAAVNTDGSDKSGLTFPEPRRIRDRDHLKFVARQPCSICGRRPSDPHHLRFAQARALGRKVSDEFSLPLCRGHHREVHRCTDEVAWWKKAGIEPLGLARTLWLKTRPLPASPDELTDRVPIIASRGTDPKTVARDRPLRRRGPNYKTKPISAAGPQ